MTWKRITFREGKTHAVHADFESLLMADLRQRLDLEPASLAPEGLGYDPAEYVPIKAITAWCFDLGGSCFVDEPMIDLGVLDGLAISAPARQVGDLAGSLPPTLQRPPRRFGDGTPYYKLHHWMFCFVASPAQLAQLAQLAATKAPEAAQQAAAFDQVVRERMARSEPLRRGRS